MRACSRCVLLPTLAGLPPHLPAQASIYEVAQKSGLKGALLERRLEAMSEALEMKVGSAGWGGGVGW